MNGVVVELGDSRRLTGPNLLADGGGAVIDGTVAGVAVERMAEAWRLRAREVLEAVGWDAEETAVRLYDGGLSVFLSAPVDALYAATEVNEWAWAAAASDVGAGPEDQPLAEAASTLRAAIAEERRPELIALQAAATEHGVSFRSDDDRATIGSGRGARSWEVDSLPIPEEVPWDAVHDIPCVLVTGTNGKTTTVRMLASIGEAAGRTVGFTCTDGIHVAGEIVDAGDWSGPGGARAVLRDPRVDVAALETARGGMLRRGLAVDRADAALVTNVAADHLGEWGVLTVDDVAAAKLVVAKAVRHGAPLIINADDQTLVLAVQETGRPVTWVAVDRAAEVRKLSGADADAWVLDDGWLVRIGRRGDESRIVEAASIPATLGGAASYNVSNALGAAALASALGLSDDAIRSGLVAFDSSPESSPGRGNLFEVGGARVLVDFVHNAHGFDAMARTVRSLGAERVGVMIGQAGDRDDESIREFVRAAWGLAPHRVAVKKMPGYERGRRPDEVSDLIRAEFAGLGADDESISIHPDELEAARALLEWSRPGDLVVLSTQADRAAVLELVSGMVD